MPVLTVAAEHITFKQLTTAAHASVAGSDSRTIWAEAHTQIQGSLAAGGCQAELWGKGWLAACSLPFV